MTRITLLNFKLIIVGYYFMMSELYKTFNSSVFHNVYVSSDLSSSLIQKRRTKMFRYIEYFLVLSNDTSIIMLRLAVLLSHWKFYVSWMNRILNWKTEEKILSVGRENKMKNNFFLGNKIIEFCSYFWWWVIWVFFLNLSNT